MDFIDGIGLPGMNRSIRASLVISCWTQDPQSMHAVCFIGGSDLRNMPDDYSVIKWKRFIWIRSLAHGSRSG